MVRAFFPCVTYICVCVGARVCMVCIRDFWPPSVVFRAYSSSAQGSFLARLQRPSVVPGVKPGSSSFQARVLPTVLSLQPNVWPFGLVLLVCFYFCFEGAELSEGNETQGLTHTAQVLHCCHIPGPVWPSWDLLFLSHTYLSYFCSPFFTTDTICRKLILSNVQTYGCKNTIWEIVAVILRNSFF